VSSPNPTAGRTGSTHTVGDAVSAVIRQHSEGRDYSDLGRLIQTSGTAASRRDRKVALTFDDGPVLQTHRVLETLERHGARGTFFLVGYKMDGHQKLIQRLLSGGHEIGNHSHGHYAFPPRDDVAACSALLEHLSGAPPGLFRPPFGAIDRPSAEAAIEDGMRVILWSVDSKDGIPPWTGISAEEIRRNVLDQVLPGSIVLLHDGLPWSRAADALPRLIEGLRGKGYQLVTVSELLADPATRRQSPTRRVLRGLGRRLRTKAASGQAVGAPTDGSGGNGAAPAEAREGPGEVERLAELLKTVAEGVEAPEEPEPASRLIQGACRGLTDRRTASDLLARHAAACEVNGVRMMGLGFSLRHFESAEGGSAPLPEPLWARLRAADDHADEAGVIAKELAGSMRVKRLIAARMAEMGSEASSSPATAPRISEASGLPVEPGDEAPSPEFLSIFSPGPEVWEELESWARETGRGVARQRMRALLDAAGVDGFDIERLVERLDVEFYFRFGYTLAACEEELSRTDS
jgi:peptidoglycan/xylan/chitin deacetylase (PgdA/CDA1 family)